MQPDDPPYDPNDLSSSMPAFYLMNLFKAPQAQ
jgi:hypothetical protein